MTHSKLSRDSSGQTSDLLSFLVGDESRHGLDSDLSCDLLRLSIMGHLTESGMTHLLSVDIDLDKLDVGVLSVLLKLGEDRTNHLTRSTPCCPEVDNDNLVTVDLAVSVILQERS